MGARNPRIKIMKLKMRVVEESMSVDEDKALDELSEHER